MPCPDCGAIVEATAPAPPPHHLRVECAACGRFLRWEAAPMTPERAAAFTMPIGKYRGLPLAAISADREGVRYLEWYANLPETKSSRSVRRAVRAHLEARR